MDFLLYLQNTTNHYATHTTNYAVPIFVWHGKEPRTAEKCCEDNIPIMDYGQHEAFVRASIPTI
jgi:hypothetical protein